MRFVLFYHSLISDWNHGNAHFLRGIVRELQGRGHRVEVYEPENGWSLGQLRAEQGQRAVDGFRRFFPDLHSRLYREESLDLDAALVAADAVLVHEWNSPELIGRVGAHRKAGGDYTLLFHDTHHRAVSEREELARCDLSEYDGVLAFGEVIRDMYLERGWTGRAWTWHEAADTTLFRPLPEVEQRGDLVWIGNWGDDERTAELHDFLLEPVSRLGLRATAHGVRYPEDGLQALQRAGIRYGGWLPNYRVPEAFAAHRVTVHVPRRPYRESLPGIPTIRVFEALACGIPLICAPWEDTEGLFSPGRDYLIARNGREMRDHLRAVLNEPDLALSLAEHGVRTIEKRHTCAHRVDELLQILSELRSDAGSPHAGWNKSARLTAPPGIVAARSSASPPQPGVRS
jgi:spore maturation protein CgeB